jgi:glycosyltransferase involved in cell wall biosynthesis
MVPDPFSARLVDGLASRWTDVVVAVSAPLADRLRQHVVARPDRVRVVYNGVDTDALRPGGRRSLRAEWGIGPDTRVIGSVGRLEPIKGYDVMIDAFARYRALPGAPSAVLAIAGDGQERARLEERARTEGIEAEIRFLGWRDDLSHLLAGFDIFALTSRSEGTSVSLLEAMSAGLCPVVTDVGGNADVLGPELAHRLVPSESPDRIAEGWADALRSDPARSRDAASARRRVEERFSLQAMVAAYESIYAEATVRAPAVSTSGATELG